MSERPLDVEELILTIHTVALTPGGWTGIISALSQALSAEAASLIRPSHDPTIKPFCHLLERDASYVTDYMNQWGSHDCWYQGAVRNRRLGVGTVNIDSQLIDRREFERSPFFNDYLRRFDIEKMINVCLIAPSEGYGPVALSLYRGLNKDNFTTTQAKLLSHLAPHLTVAARNYWAAQSLRLLANARANALDAVTAGVFALNHSGQVMFANRMGEDMIRQSAWIRVLKGRLAPTANLHPLDHFAAALSQVSSGIGRELLITDLATGAQAQVSIVPFPVDIDLGCWPTSPYSLIWVTPIAPRRDVGRDMARLFHLTPAEQRILDKLIAGDDLLEAAAALRISKHTARTQLKSMFRKTGRRSQGQLLMLAARIATLTSTRG